MKSLLITCKNMDKDELRKHKEEIIGLLKSTGLEEMDDFIAELENTGYFTAPASMNGHMCYEGGLMIHSLNVYYAARELKATFGKMRPDVFERISDASIIIATLLHDMCKSNLYYKKRNAAYELGQSQYGSDQGSLPVGHGEKSVIMLLQMGLGLTDAEICAIRWHMGAWSVNPTDGESKGDFRRAADLYPLVSLVQLADSVAASILERKYTTINS
ncbi:MAG TPA: HD family phosphohydrolase [Porphyromonadaceae bacterium]|nr:HD family phosphohydrolase [Porphyromonadaceae bacterium]